MAEPFLSHQERDSPAWQKIKKHLEQRLKKLREDNDKDNVNADKQRARIAEVKLLLGLEDPPPAAEKDDSRFKD